jgi:CRISPR-associated protein Csd1
MPICHSTQQAQIEIVLDGNGAFKRASVIEKAQGTTLIPCTESSAGRAGSKPVNHPLCDKLQYVSKDFLAFGGEVTSGFAKEPEVPHQDYLVGLSAWAASEWSHPKLTAILHYVEKGSVVEDLVTAGILQLGKDGKLLKSWSDETNPAPAIFKVIQNTQAPEDAFVRWRVESAPDDPLTATWQDQALIESWIEYYQHTQALFGICMVTGQESALAIQHPAKLRHAGDKAKLISANDNSGYTFRGKFIEAEEVISVGFDVTQKAHNALRWLLANQGYRKGDQAIVSWAVSGVLLPSPIKNIFDQFELDSSDIKVPASSVGTDQNFALRLKKAVAGYGAKLDPKEDVVVIGLDSATPGRMAISFYRELKGSDFLKRLEAWHARYAWHQNFGKDSRFIGAPAPPDIAEAAYGRRLDEKLQKATVERLLPCIVDGWDVPLDLMRSTVRRATNRVGLEHWEWEKVLGIACALFKGYHQERNYQMDLETERNSRDYLYGRLLAIADSIEGYALSTSDEGKKRETTACRLMQRFSVRPFSTWLTIELALRPYQARMQAGSDRSVGLLVKRGKLLDEVISQLNDLPERTSDAPLSGEFLLGYHAQRKDFWPAADADKQAANADSQAETTN